VDLGPLVDLTVGAFVDFTDDKRRFFCKSSTRRSLLTRLFAVGAFVDETLGLLVDLTVGLLVDLGPLVDLTVGAFVDFTDDKRRFFCKSSTRRSLLTRLFAVGAFVDETVGLLVDLTVGLLVDFGPLVDLTVGAFVDFTDDRLRISCAAKAFDETAKRRATRNNWVDFIFDVWA
jgi:hypothetical protein